MCNIIKCVAVEVADAELGALFVNCKEGGIFPLVIQVMGHSQPPTPVHRGKYTATDITNNLFALCKTFLGLNFDVLLPIRFILV